MFNNVFFSLRVLDIRGWYQDIGFGERKRLLRLTTQSQIAMDPLLCGLLDLNLPMKAQLVKWHLPRTECDVYRTKVKTANIFMHSNHGTNGPLTDASSFRPQSVAATPLSNEQQPENTVIPSQSTVLACSYRFLRCDILLWPASTWKID